MKYGDLTLRELLKYARRGAEAFATDASGLALMFPESGAVAAEAECAMDVEQKIAYLASILDRIDGGEEL